jgi:DNA-binding NtrC family response regulator
VVEDEDRLRDLLLGTIPDMGFRAKAAATGEQALRAMERHACDIVLLDLNLPGMQGLEFFARLRERWPDTQVIILTGCGDLEAARQSIRLEVVDFLTKPASLGEIEQSLERARRRLPEPSTPPGSESHTASPRPPSEDEAEPLELSEIERRHILAALERNHGNRAAAASELGISVRKLYYKLAEYDRRPSDDVSPQNH